MEYINKKTRAVISTDCEISGGDWVVKKSASKKNDKLKPAKGGKATPELPDDSLDGEETPNEEGEDDE